LGYRNREIEVKLEVLGTSDLYKVNKKVEEFVENAYKDFEYIVGDATDWYWHTPDQSDGDFVRLRRKPGGAEITMKAVDKGDPIDRVEIDLAIEGWEQGKILMTGVFGPPVEKVRKKYHVYFLEDEHTTISVYKVRGDDRVFLEVEAKSLSRVKELTLALKNALPDTDIVRVGSSIYEIFVAKDKPRVQTIEDFLETA